MNRILVKFGTNFWITSLIKFCTYKDFKRKNNFMGFLMYSKKIIRMYEWGAQCFFSSNIVWKYLPLKFKCYPHWWQFGMNVPNAAAYMNIQCNLHIPKLNRPRRGHGLLCKHRHKYLISWVMIFLKKKPLPQNGFSLWPELLSKSSKDQNVHKFKVVNYNCFYLASW